MFRYYFCIYEVFDYILIVFVMNVLNVTYIYLDNINFNQIHSFLLNKIYQDY